MRSYQVMMNMIATWVSVPLRGKEGAGPLQSENGLLH